MESVRRATRCLTAHPSCKPREAFVGPVNFLWLVYGHHAKLILGCWVAMPDRVPVRSAFSLCDIFLLASPAALHPLVCSGNSSDMLEGWEQGPGLPSLQ